jgi:hypothetical protein
VLLTGCCTWGASSRRDSDALLAFLLSGSAFLLLSPAETPEDLTGSEALCGAAVDFISFFSSDTCVSVFWPSVVLVLSLRLVCAVPATAISNSMPTSNFVFIVPVLKGFCLIASKFLAKVAKDPIFFEFIWIPLRTILVYAVCSSKFV